MNLKSYVNTIYTISIICKYKKVLLVIFIQCIMIEIILFIFS